MAPMETTIRHHPDERKRTNLRLPQDMQDHIDDARRLRPGKVSRNTWIVEAIQEKLAREGTEKKRRK